VDAERFLRELPSLFDDFPRSAEPRDPRFREILDTVENLASANTLALVHHAASLLGPGESYVEVGTFHGASLVAALLDHDELDAVAIDSFVLSGTSRESVEASLNQFGLGARATILVGDVFELVPSGALDGRKVGVWYYDAAHDYDSQVRGLRIVEPYLVPGALLIVDDTDWDRVERALDDYLAEQPLARRLLTLEGKDRGSPQWWEGMQVLTWEA
jgi:predicted O-methyltransferase YrrM